MKSCWASHSMHECWSDGSLSAMNVGVMSPSGVPLIYARPQPTDGKRKRNPDYAVIFRLA